MKRDEDLQRTGVWIDHERATVVILTNGCVKLARIRSGVEKHVRLSGGPRCKTPYGPQHIADDKKLDRRRSQELGDFYGEVAKALKNADRIYLFGPGEAKHGLEKQVRRSKTLASKIMAVHPEDKMTEDQIIAKVKAFYGMQPKRFTVSARRPRG